jgi:hypothetical protein
MRLVSVALVIGILTACGSGEPAFELTKPSCSQDFVSYNGGLTWDIMQGGGAGDFDFDPDGRVEAREFGEYVLTSGDFVYTVQYDPDHYRTETRVEGYGYANPNGDLDTEATWTTTDVHGDHWSTDVRVQRVGCNETTYQIRNGYLTTITGTYTAAGYEYTREYDGGYSDTVKVDGLLKRDLTYDESYDVEDGTLSYSGDTSGDADGNSRTDFVQSDTDYTMDGYFESTLDGTQHQSYHYDGSDVIYDWDVTVDYDGNGGGTYSTADGSCDISYDSGACTYDCGGSTGDC